MKTKLEMAVQMIVAEVRRVGITSIDNDKVIDAWNLADAMQAAADKREKQNKDEFYANLADPMKKVREQEWQPDWSQAPDDAMYWAMDGCGQCNWYKREPDICGSQWDFGGVIEQADTGCNYQGDWRESLRKRPK